MISFCLLLFFFDTCNRDGWKLLKKSWAKGKNLNTVKKKNSRAKNKTKNQLLKKTLVVKSSQKKKKEEKSCNNSKNVYQHSKTFFYQNDATYRKTSHWTNSDIAWQQMHKPRHFQPPYMQKTEHASTMTASYSMI